MPVHIQDKEKILVAFNHLWNELDKTWQPVEGSTNVKRPENWDATCEQMYFLMEQLGIEYNNYGTLL